MLTVTRLKLSNICQYDEIDIPIETGLMAVCGRNGSGKSTLLRGLMYGLTGLVDGSWGTQANLQKDGCITPGYVVVTLKDDQTNKEYIVKRYSTAGNKFADSVTEFQNGEYQEVATRRKTVDAYLGELYGISCALLFQLCWGRQGQLDMLLTAPAAYVSTFLSGVWNTKHLETLRDRLKTAIDQVAVMADPMQDITNAAVEKHTLETKLKDLVPSIASLREQHKDLEAEKETYESEASKNTLEDAKKVATLTERLAVVESNINTWLQELENADLDAVKDLTEQELTQAFNVAQKALETHSRTASESVVSLNSLNVSIQTAKATIASLQEEYNRVVDEHTRVLNLIGSESDTCAFCGHHLDNKGAYVQNTLMVLGYYDEETATDTFSQKEEDLRQQIDATNRRIGDLEAGREQIRKEHDSAKRMAEQDSAQLESINSKRYTVQCLTKYAAVIDKRDALKAELDKYAKNATSDELSANITRVSLAICDVEDLINVKEKERVSTEARIQALNEIINRLEAEKEQYDVNCSARSMLVLLRDVFSQQRAQARYFASKAGELNEHLAAFLELTGMPFNLRLDPDTRLFSYTTEGGFEHPTAHLSGAQKNISAVALQMALVEVIRPNINLFLFDEPSESLDVENKIVMADLFRRMNRMLPSIGGTMLIVSRDEQLIESCENVININSKEESNND